MTPLRRLLVIIALLIAARAASAQPVTEVDPALSSGIDRIIDAPSFENGFWGIHVVALDEGRTLYARNDGKSFVPASNVKLYTTAAALDLLSPSFRFETTLYAQGPIENGILRGNLIVRGDADPTFGGHYAAEDGNWDADVDALRVFRDWADSLRAAGIYRIEGHVVGDDDVIDDEPLGANWSWDDETYYYSAQLSGLSFHDNVVHLYVTGRDRAMPAEIRWEPLNTDYIRVINRTRTIAANTPRDEGYHRIRGTNTVEVTTTVPEGEDDLEEITVENPTSYFVHVLRENLLRSGIVVRGDPVDVDDLAIKPDYDHPSYRRIAIHRSLPLADVTALINKPSQNLYADLLLKTIGARQPADDDELQPGSAEMGIEAAMSTFVSAGIDTSRIRIADGSGLSRLNLVMPRMTTQLLAYMWRHDDVRVRDAFFDSLPIGGEHGTLRFRLTSSEMRGRVRAKTGTLSAASSLSGYVRTEEGRTLAFSIMSNHYTSRSESVRAAQDAIARILVGFRP